MIRAYILLGTDRNGGFVVYDAVREIGCAHHGPRNRDGDSGGVFGRHRRGEGRTKPCS